MSEPSLPRERQNLGSVQVLRGLSALLVLAFHTSEVAKKKLGVSLTAAVDFGHAGVDFFFVLSGFIICYVHFSDLGRPSRLKSYLLKRFIRVCPLYWAITAAIVATALLGFSVAGEADLSLKRIATSFLFIPQAQKPILGVGWTLAHEMFFYGLFSLMIWLPLKVALPALGVWLLSVLVRLVAFPADFDSVALNFVLNQHNLQFAIGCVVGWRVVTGFRVPPLVFLIAGAVLFVGSGLLDVFYRWHLNPFLQYGIASGLMLLGAASGDLAHDWNPPGWLVTIGAASYSIYLVHLAALNLVAMVAIKAGVPSVVGKPVTVAIVSAASLLTGLATHFWVERPLLETGRRWLLTPRAA